MFLLEILMFVLFYDLQGIFFLGFSSTLFCLNMTNFFQSSIQRHEGGQSLLQVWLLGSLAYDNVRSPRYLFLNFSYFLSLSLSPSIFLSLSVSLYACLCHSLSLSISLSLSFFAPPFISFLSFLVFLIIITFSLTVQF